MQRYFFHPNPVIIRQVWFPPNPIQPIKEENLVGHMDDESISNIERGEALFTDEMISEWIIQSGVSSCNIQREKIMNQIDIGRFKCHGHSLFSLVTNQEIASFEDRLYHFSNVSYNITSLGWLRPTHDIIYAISSDSFEVGDVVSVYHHGGVIDRKTVTDASNLITFDRPLITCAYLKPWITIVRDDAPVNDVEIETFGVLCSISLRAWLMQEVDRTLFGINHWCGVPSLK